MAKNNNPGVRKENVLAGIIGALLFSLAGGICWFVLYQVGFLAGISGLVGAICAVKGYQIFARKLSIKGVIISIIAALLVMTAAWYLCLCWDICKVYGESGVPMTIIEAAKFAPSLLQDKEVLAAYLKDLFIGLALCVVGAFTFFKNIFQSIKQNKAAAQAAAAVSSQPVEQPAAEAAVEVPAEAAVEAPAEAVVEETAEVTEADSEAEAAVEAPVEAAVEAAEAADLANEAAAAEAAIEAEAAAAEMVAE